MDIYDYEKRLNSIEKNIKFSQEILQENKELIYKFKNDCFANNIGLARVIRYLYCLRDTSKWLGKPFGEANVDDLKELVTKIERMPKYSARTKYEYRATLKKFYKWFKQMDKPPETSWIKLNFKKHNDKLPTELLTEKDILAMINATKNVRDRAIIIGLYESGCRVGEFLKLRIGDVSFDKVGCFIDVTGKTGGRRVRLITSTNYFLELINKHPDKDNPKAFLWLRNNSLEMQEYPALCKSLRTAAERANVKRKVNPHSFRHARATYLASKLTEQQLKVFFGWVRSSEMASVYVHLSCRDVNDALLKTYGISTGEEDKTISDLTPIKCKRCDFENEATSRFCRTCGFPLNKEEAEKIIIEDTKKNRAEEILDKILKDPEVLAIIQKKINS